MVVWQYASVQLLRELEVQNEVSPVRAARASLIFDMKSRRRSRACSIGVRGREKANQQIIRVCE